MHPRIKAGLRARRAAAANDAHEPRADFMAEPPDHLIVALLRQSVAGQQQDEVIGHFEAFDMQPHAAGRKVCDQQSRGSVPVASWIFAMRLMSRRCEWRRSLDFAKEFAKDPFMLVFEVDRDDIEGWTGKGPVAPRTAPKKAPKKQ